MAADRLELRFTKWDGRPHRRYSTRVLGSDEYGLWVVTDDQSVVTWGDGSRGRFPAVALTWIPPDAAWWTVSWTTDRDSDGSEPVDVYGNISAPGQRDNTGITLIDLDLDVVSSGDGFQIVDYDDFERNAQEMTYPQPLIRKAVASAEELLQILRTGEIEPLATVHSSWLRRWLSAPPGGR
jgi:uncharacterized protein